jgi:hypothetical protein
MLPCVKLGPRTVSGLFASDSPQAKPGSPCPVVYLYEVPRTQI